MTTTCRKNGVGCCTFVHFCPNNKGRIKMNVNYITKEKFAKLSKATRKKVIVKRTGEMVPRTKEELRKATNEASNKYKKSEKGKKYYKKYKKENKEHLAASERRPIRLKKKRIYGAKWKKLNKEHIAEYNSSPERVKQRKQYVLDNPIGAKRRAQTYRAKNREAIRQRGRDYYHNKKKKQGKNNGK